MGGIDFCDVEARRERTPCVNGFDDGVRAETVVVTGGHKKDVREGFLERFGAFFNQRETVRLAFVIRVDIGVFQQVAAFGLFVDGAQAFDFSGNLVLLPDGGVTKAEGGEFSFVVEILNDFEIRGRLDVDVAPVKEIVGQEVRIDEFHLGPIFDAAALWHGRLFERWVVPCDGGRQRRLVRQREIKNGDGERELHGLDVVRLNGQRATIDARRLAAAGMGANPEGLQFALLDGDGRAEVENRIGPPADVIDRIGRRIFRLDVADGVDLDVRRRIDFMCAVFQKRRQTDGHVREIAMQRHDGDLNGFLFVLRQCDRAFGGAADSDGHVFWKDFLHARGDADQHIRDVKPRFDAGFREGDDGDGPFEDFRYAL